MKTKTVKVRAIGDGTGGVEFEVDGVKAKHAALKLDKDSGDHTIVFDLEDHSDGNLRFDPDDPIWVDEDCPCPPAKGMNSDQITLVERKPQKLVVTNENGGRARDIRYQLNFVTSDGSRAECDPIIQNGGGIKPPSG